MTPEAAQSAGRADFVAAVVADERRRVGGRWEALGWVLADLHAGWPLTHDYGSLTRASTASAPSSWLTSSSDSAGVC